MTYVELLSNAEVRADRVIWLPGAVATDFQPADFVDFAKELPANPLDPLYDVLPELRALAEPDFVDVEAVAMALEGRNGFLVQGAHPIRTYLAPHRWESGWGHYATCWFYVEAAHDIATVLALWAEELDLASMRTHEAAK